MLTSSNYSRRSWFCRIRLSSSHEKTTKTAVALKLFPFATVSLEKSSFEMTVRETLFCFHTVILCYLDSCKVKKQDKNCWPKPGSTVQKRQFMIPTAAKAVENQKSKIRTVNTTAVWAAASPWQLIFYYNPVCAGCIMVLGASRPYYFSKSQSKNIAFEGCRRARVPWESIFYR